MPATAKRCFIPAVVLGTLKIPKTLKRKAVLGIPTISGDAKKGEAIRIRGTLVSGDPKILARFLTEGGLVRRGSVLVGDALIDVVGKKPCEKDVSILPEGKNVVEKTPTLVQEITEELRLLSDASGYRFRVLFHLGPSVPPFAKEPGVINLVIGAAPPGAVEFEYVSKLLDINLERPGYGALRYGAVLGYGMVLEDGAGTDFAQLVDTTLYFLVPVGSREQLMVLSKKQGPNLFGRILARAWTAYFAKRAGPKTKPLASLEQFEEHMEKRFDFMKKQGEEAISTCTLKIEKLRQDLFRKMEERRAIQFTQSGIDAYTADLQRNCKKEWEVLTKHPLIASLKEVNDALQVETKPILAEHDGKRYQLGTFGIRYALGTRVSVWALSRPHPKGISHPHISPDGVVCFGNVEQAIIEAAVDVRASEVIHIVLRWLVEGYDPRLADTPIEEWPLEKERGKLLAPKKAL